MKHELHYGYNLNIMHDLSERLKLSETKDKAALTAVNFFPLILANLREKVVFFQVQFKINSRLSEV